MRLNATGVMKIKSFATLCLIPGFFITGTAIADIRLPKLFANNAVFQRDAKIAVWGWADPNEKIQLSFHRTNATTRANEHGNWLTFLGPFPAGGPYDLMVKGKNQVTVHNILLGDVWLAAGQSNMEFSVGRHGEFAGLRDANTEVVNASYSKIRLLVVEHNPAFKPASDVETEGWRPVTPDAIGDFSAVAYLFGREIHTRYNVPIGLIQSTFGGTPAEAWTSAEGLSSFPEFQAAIESVSHVTAENVRAYADYRDRREQWYQRHAAESFPPTVCQTSWADPELDASKWPTIIEPRPDDAWGKDFNGFDGAVWFRKVVILTSQQASKPMLLHLGSIAMDDATYVNGKKVGSTSGWGDSREYLVPTDYLHTGSNHLAILLVGAHDPTRPDLSGIGIFGPADSLRAELNGSSVSLAGQWSYHPAVDLGDFPVMPHAAAEGKPDKNSPTELFNGMINPLIPFAIKGVIWYQGEDNTPRAVQYQTLFPALIFDWRHRWGYQFPFLFVQLAGFGADQSESDEPHWAELREAQTMALSVPRTGMATAVDIGDAHDVHPSNKQDVAHRLALSAMKVAYGEDVVDSGPTYQSMQVDNGSIRIKFSSVANGLQVKDGYGYLRGFEIAASVGKYIWAQAKIVGKDEVLVSASSIKEPAKVRYDWSNMPDGDLYNSESLPALPFRTEAIN